MTRTFSFSENPILSPPTWHAMFTNKGDSEYFSSSSLNKLPLLAAFGVPEVWLFDRETVEFLLLEQGDYHIQTTSLALPRVDSERITGFVTEGSQMGWLEWMKNVREWACERKDS